MTKDISGEVVLVTGATSGIGRAVTDAYWRRGAAVIATGIDEEQLQTIRDEYDERIHCAFIDVRDAEDVNRAISGLPSEFASITVLVNNAGLARGLERIPYTKYADWRVMVDTNVLGVLHTVEAVVPGMVERNQGYVVNIGSIAADTPYAGGNVYGSTKAFIRQFTLNLRSDLLGTKVRAACVEPGMVKTEFLKVRFDGDARRAESLYQGVDHLTAADIADLIVFMTSLPLHVSIPLIQVLPTEQAHGGYSFAAPISLEPTER